MGYICALDTNSCLFPIQWFQRAKRGSNRKWIWTVFGSPSTPRTSKSKGFTTFLSHRLIVPSCFFVSWSFIDQCVKDRGTTDLSKILNQTTLYRVLLLCKKQGKMNKHREPAQWLILTYTLGVVDSSILRPREIQLDPALKRDRTLGEIIQSHRLETYFDESIVAISII